MEKDVMLIGNRFLIIVCKKKHNQSWQCQVEYQNLLLITRGRFTFTSEIDIRSGSYPSFYETSAMLGKPQLYVWGESYDRDRSLFLIPDIYLEPTIESLKAMKNYVMYMK